MMPGGADSQDRGSPHVIREHQEEPRLVELEHALQSDSNSALLTRYPWSIYIGMPKGVQEAMELAVLQELVLSMNAAVVKANLLRCWEAGSFENFMRDDDLMALIQTDLVDHCEEVSISKSEELQSCQGGATAQPMQTPGQTYPNRRRMNSLQLALSGGNFYDIKGDFWQIFYSENHESRIPEWLSAMEYSTTHNDISKKRTPRTGTWLLNSKIFQNWLTNPFYRILWCPGIPGVGKTVIASLVIDHLRQTKTIFTPVVFIYYSYQLQGKQDLFFTLACLARQLYEICRAKDLDTSFEELYVLHMEHRSRPTLQQLQAAISATITQFKQVYVVLDGLDEYLEHYSDKAIRELLQTVVSLGDNVKLMTTSRVVGEMETIFSELSAKKETIEAQKEDLSIYLEHRLANTDFQFEVSNKLAERIVQQVQGAAKGRFLMAELHMNSLRSQFSPGDIRDALDTLPDEVDKTYAKVMDQIATLPKSRKELALKTFLWLTRCHRPLALNELQHALAIKADRDDIFDYTPSISAITSACLGLVIVEDQKVTFVHFTAQEYFNKEHAEQLSHADVASLCLDYITLPSMRKVAPEYLSGSKEITQLEQAYPLYRYAATSWGHHIRAGDYAHSAAERAISLIEAADPVFDLSFASILESLEWNDSVPNSAGGNKIFLFVYHHLPSALERALANVTGYPVTECNRTAFHLAVQLGEVDFLEAMLRQWELVWSTPSHPISPSVLQAENASSPTDQGTPLQPPNQSRQETDQTCQANITNGRQPFNINVQTEDGRTLLWFAARYGQTAVAKLLLQQPSLDVNLPDTDGITPLCTAAFLGFTEIVRMLLQVPGIDAHRAGLDGETPMLAAMMNGSSSCVELLLADQQADINAMQKDDRTLFSWAAEFGHLSVVQLLLRHPGIDVNQVDASELGGTPLLAAASNGQEAVVRLLLEHPLIDVNAHNSTNGKIGASPLHGASLRGHDSVVRILLDRPEIDVNIKADFRLAYMITPLMGAAALGNVRIVEMLLEDPRIDLGIDPSTGDTQGDVALVVAMASDEVPSIAHLLLEKGNARPGVRTTFRGLSALSVAAECGQERVVETLLGFDTVDVNCQDDDQDTPLLLAAQNAHTSVVARLLSEPGIRVNQQNKAGRTALSMACHHPTSAFYQSKNIEKSRSQATPVVQLLLSQNEIDVNLADAEGKTPLDYALESGFTEIVQMLRERGAIGATDVRE